MEYIPVLSIAGSDCSGGAGIQADLKTFSALGCYGMTVITAITIQNTCGVKDSIPVPADVVGRQMQTVMEDIRPRCIKIGMIADRPTLLEICRILGSFPDIPVVYDCVMLSSSGRALMDEETREELTHKLLPLCTLVTPNLPEAEVLSGLTLHDEATYLSAARLIMQSGCHAVLIKGGHDNGAESTDRLYIKGDRQSPYLFSSPRLSSSNTHGTGCTLSSAICAHLARGCDLNQAVANGKFFLTEALRQGRHIHTGNGVGPLNHFFAPEKQIIR